MTVFASVCAASVLGGGPAATACGCGETRGPLVATGSSPRGVKWLIRAHRDGRSFLEVDFSLAPPGYEDAGYATQLPFPLPRRFIFTAIAGSGLDPYGEQDVSGLSARRVRSVTIELSDHSSVVTRPRLARRAAYRTHRWVRGMRFFDVFLSSSAAPRRAIARDARGRVLDRVRLR